MKTTLLSLFCSLMSLAVIGQIDFKVTQPAPYVSFGNRMVVGDFDGNDVQDVIFTASPSTIVAYYTVGDEVVQKIFNFTQGSGDFLRIAVGDINLDGKDDLVVLDYVTVGAKTLYKAISTGTDFDVSVISRLQGDWWSDVDLLHFDNDEYLDIVAMSSGGPMLLWNGSATGEFQQAENSIIPVVDGYDFFFTDLNNDEQSDIIIKSYSLLISYINRGGIYERSQLSLDTPESFNIESEPVVADFNGDDLPDVVAVTTINSQTYLKFFENNGEEGFEDPVEILTSTSIRNVRHGDYDGDGNQDLVVSSFWEATSLRVLRNLGNATFEDRLAASVSLFDASFADLDNSGKMEIVALASGDKKLSVFKHDGDEYIVADEYIFGVVLRDGTIYDLDKDGHDDVIGASNNDIIAVWYNTGDGQFDEPVFHPVPGSAVAVAAADFNGDEIGDIAFRSMSSTKVLLSTGARSYELKVISDSDAPTFLSAADVNNDGSADLVGTDIFWVNDGEGNFTRKTVSFPNGVSYFHASATGNFNDDDFIDLAVSADRKTIVFYNDGAGNFPEYQAIPDLDNSYAFRVVDLNNDNRDDLVTYMSVQDARPKIGLATRMEDGTFEMTYISEEQPMYFEAISAADMNQDGLTDIAVVYQITTGPGTPILRGIGVYLAKEQGGYLPLTLFEQTGDLGFPDGNGLRLHDINDDGKTDAIVFALNGPPVSIVLQDDVTEPTTVSTLSVVPGATTATITIQPGNGNGRLVLMRKEPDAEADLPADNTFLQADLAFGEGDESGSGNYAVLSGAETAVIVENLEPLTAYVVTMFEYSATAGHFIVDYLPTPVTASFTTEGVVGLEDEDSKFSISPNPVKDIATITYPSTLTGEPAFYNSLGHKFELPVVRSDNSVNVDTSSLPAGMYFVRLQNISLKFLK